MPQILYPFPKKAARGVPGGRQALLVVELSFVGAVLQVPAHVPRRSAGEHAHLQAVGRQEPDRRRSGRGDRSALRDRTGGRRRCPHERRPPTLPEFQPGDYKTDLKPVWCAGCGDFGVLTGALPRDGRAPARAVEHGRRLRHRLLLAPPRLRRARTASTASTAAPSRSPTGVKVARPELNVIAVGGDGDGLAIGGNHFMHRPTQPRRPTSSWTTRSTASRRARSRRRRRRATRRSRRTTATPSRRVDPCELAISFGATWVGRAFSGDLKGTVELMVKRFQHNGFAFLNVMSPCVTWRGDDQFKTLKAKQRQLPEDHDARRARRRSCTRARRSS